MRYIRTIEQPSSRGWTIWQLLTEIDKLDVLYIIFFNYIIFTIKLDSWRLCCSITNYSDIHIQKEFVSNLSSQRWHLTFPNARTRACLVAQSDMCVYVCAHMYICLFAFICVRVFVRGRGDYRRCANVRVYRHKFARARTTSPTYYTYY